MAAPSLSMLSRAFSRISPVLLQCIRQTELATQRTLVSTWFQPPCVYIHSNRLLFTTVSKYEKSADVDTEEISSRYKDRPWDYLESEEYADRYGSKPVWFNYRRNHKGGIPPQQTRKTCIRGDKICGNPCPICRDPNVIIHYQNVKLLQQFVHPHSGEVYEHTRTGVCMKQQKLLKKAIDSARDHGLLPFQVPFVDHSGEDYSNSHDAVGCTPSRPSVTADEPWYPWYLAQADESEVAKVKKIYKAYLK
uniref:Small ribosomal subunit protein mS40 n=1 Tax=Paramormyrops kingsleyae TaxID=1676925 RepID=A0A3B3SGU5_9TELE|nr:28S ribosomal protein S18b, mitochondrial [Paramormyrops kingsleyae]